MLETIIKLVAFAVLCIWIFRFVWRNFIGGLMKFIAILVLCALAWALINLAAAMFYAIGWFVFAAVGIFVAGLFFKLIKG